MATAVKHRGGRPKRAAAAAPKQAEASSHEAVPVLKGVLVAVDFTPPSDKAFDFAVKLLQNQRQAHLYLINVVTPHIIAGSESAPDALLMNMQIQEDEVNSAKVKMEEKVSFAREHGISKAMGVVVVSDPVHAILDKAEELKVDLILLGNRRRGYARGIIFGSVSERVAAESPMSVLIVR